MEERLCPFCSSSMIEYEGDSLYHCKTCGNYIAENEFENDVAEKEEKKLYFMHIDELDDDDRTHYELTDEEFKEKANFVYTIPEYVADFNSEMAPTEVFYFCRYI